MKIRQLFYLTGFVFLFVCFLSGSCFAATYYVGTNGKDTNNGSLAAPWATLNRANAVAVSGDTVYVRGGIYNQKAYLDKAGVTWRAYTGEVPIIDGGWPGTLAGDSQGLPTGTDRYAALIFIVGSNITFDGFEVRNSRGRGIEVYGAPITNVTIRNCKAHHTFNESFLLIGGTKPTQWVTKSLVENCEFYNGAMIRPIYSSRADGTPGTVLVTRFDGLTFRKNKVHDSWYDGVLVGGNVTGDYSSANAIIEYNQIYGNYQDQLVLVGNRYNTVRYNLIYGTYPNANGENGRGSGIWFANETTWNLPNCYSESHVYGNLIANTLVNMWVEGQGATCKIYNTYWYNNTSIEATSSNFYIESWAGGGHIFKNNLVIQSAGSTRIGGAPSGVVTANYNHWSRIPASTLCGRNDTTYPGYASTSPLTAKSTGWNSLRGASLTGKEFALQSGSVCIRKGTTSPVTNPPQSFLNVGLSNFLTNVFNLVNQNATSWDIGGCVFSSQLSAPGAPYVASVTP
ncbi:MAG: right-handed parallel beta-helix repeat-containing protein [Syntrophobacteraceae bacterium]|nr:right-handed parallel beta-helix repeat-containing protein [Desulfobacteraceae bacterium]